MTNILLFNFLALCVSSFAWAKACGSFVTVQGQVEVKSSASSVEWLGAKVGQKVCEGSSLKTGASAKARIVMLDKNVISLDSDSEVYFEKYEYQPGQQKKTQLNLLYGLVRASVNQKYEENREFFRVKTKTAVVGVRGTDFVTRFDRQSNSSEVVAFTGSLNVFKVDERGNFGAPVRVSPGFSVTVENHQEPSRPVRVPEDRLKKMDQQTRLFGAEGGSGKDGGLDKKPPSRSDGMRSEEQRPQPQGRRMEQDNPRRNFERIGPGPRDSRPNDSRQGQQEQQREMVREQLDRRREVPSPANQPRPSLPPPSLPPPPSGEQQPPPPPPPN